MSAMTTGMPRLGKRWGYDRIGFGLLALLLASAVMALTIPTARPDGNITVVIETTMVGHGITADTHVVLRGTPFGRVTSIETTETGARLTLDLDRTVAQTLTSTMSIDFAPYNYFGVAAVNVIPEPGGRPLEHGAVIARAETPDNTIGALIERGGPLVTNVLDADLVQTIDTVARYIGTVVPAVKSVLDVLRLRQTTRQRPLSEDLRALARITDELPSLTAYVLDAHAVLVRAPWMDRVIDNNEPLDLSLKLIGTGFFGPIGHLLGSPRENLGPATEIVRLLSNYFADTVTDAGSSQRLRAAFQQAAGSITGGPDAPVLHLRVILDQFPAIATALGGVQ